MHKLQSLDRSLQVIASVKSLALAMASVGECVSTGTGKRKADGQRELQKEAGKSKKRSVAASIGVAKGGLPPPPIELLPIIKMTEIKYYCFFSFV